MEIITLANDNIVAFFPSITALQEKNTEKRKNVLDEGSRKGKYTSNKESDGEESEEDEESVANEEEKINYPGVSFWIVGNWLKYGIEKVEPELTKEFLEAGLNIRKCKAVRRSFILIYIFIFMCYVTPLMIY